MAYDVFISYANPDRAWAARLAADLKARGANCFFDQASLREGQGWEGQIRAALLDSKHLVCLWSQAAKDSVWVTRELATFDLQHPAAADASLLIKLRLDETQSAYSSLQQIREQALLDAYAQQQPAPDAAWTAVVKRLREAVKRDPHRLSVPVALLTMRAADVARIGAPERADIAAQLELDAPTLAARYGPTHGDWKPFVDSPKHAPDGRPGGGAGGAEPAEPGWRGAHGRSVLAPLHIAFLELVIRGDRQPVPLCSRPCPSTRP